MADIRRLWPARLSPGRTSLPFLLLGLALLPSLIPLFVPVYEADVAALMSSPDDHPLAFWLSFGRPLLYPVIMPLMSVGRWIGLPAAAHVYSVFYLGGLALCLWLLWRVLTHVLGGRLAAAATVTAMGLHFHFYEIRLWSGSNVMLAGAAALVAVLWVLEHPHTRIRVRAAVACVASFIALNLHQSGAFFIPAIVGLCFARDILHRHRFRDGRFSRGGLAIAVGFATACALYAVEMLIVKQTIGLPPRADGSNILFNFGGYAKRLPLWAACILPLPEEFRDHPFAMGGLALGIAWLAWRCPRVRTGRKVRAAVVILGASIAACLPTLVTDGNLSSRVLLGPLIALWGGVALFLCSWTPTPFLGHLRSGACVVLGAAMLLSHLWGFGLAVGVKHTTVNLTRQLHQHLQTAQMGDGAEVTFHGANHNTHPIAWSDSGLQIYGASWGAEAMLHPIFGKTPLPENLGVRWAGHAPIPMDAISTWHSPLVFENHDGTWGINAGPACLRQLEVEQRFVRPFRREYEMGLGAVGACSTAIPAESFLYRPFRTPEHQFSLRETKASAGARLVLTAVDIDAPLQLSASCRNVTPTVEASLTVRWYSSGEELARYEMGPGSSEKIDVSLPAHRSDFLTLEVRGLNGPARVQFTQAEIRYER